MSESRDEESEAPPCREPFGGKPRPYTPPDLPRLRDGSEMQIHPNYLRINVEQASLETNVAASKDLAGGIFTTIRLQGRWHKTLWQMGDHERDGSLSGLPVLININRIDGGQPVIKDWDPPHLGIGRLKHNNAVVDESIQWDRSLDALLSLGADPFDAMRAAINEATAAKARLTATMSVKGWGDDWNQEVPLLITDIQLYSEVDLQPQEGEEDATLDNVREAVDGVREAIEGTQGIMSSIAGRLDAFGVNVPIFVFVMAATIAIIWLIGEGVGSLLEWLRNL